MDAKVRRWIMVDGNKDPDSELTWSHVKDVREKTFKTLEEWTSFFLLTNKQLELMPPIGESFFRDIDTVASFYNEKNNDFCVYACGDSMPKVMEEAIKMMEARKGRKGWLMKEIESGQGWQEKNHIVPSKKK